MIELMLSYQVSTVTKGFIQTNDTIFDKGCRYEHLLLFKEDLDFNERHF